MPAQPDDVPEYLDDDHQRIAEFAADFLEEDERDDFVDQLLERRGYTRVSRWAAPEPDAGGGRGGQGGRRPLVRSRQQGSRQQQGGRQQQQRGSYFGGRRG